MNDRDDLNRRVISVLAAATRALRVEELRLALGGMPRMRTSQALSQCKERGLVSCGPKGGGFDKWSLTRKGHASVTLRRAPVFRLRVTQVDEHRAIY